MAFDWDAHIREQVNEFNRKLMMPTQSLGYAGGGAVQRTGLAMGTPIQDVRQQPTTPILSPAQQPTITIGISADRQPGTTPVTAESLNPLPAVSAGQQPRLPAIGLADGGSPGLWTANRDASNTNWKDMEAINAAAAPPAATPVAPATSIATTAAPATSAAGPSAFAGMGGPTTEFTTSPTGSSYVGADYNQPNTLLSAFKGKPNAFGTTANARLGIGLANSGVIPGKVDPTVADDVTINAKIGEYYFSPEVVAALGGPQVLDALAASVKQSIGLPPTVGPKMHNEPDAMGRMDKPGLADGGPVDREMYDGNGPLSRLITNPPTAEGRPASQPAPLNYDTSNYGRGAVPAIASAINTGVDRAGSWIKDTFTDTNAANRPIYGQPAAAPAKPIVGLPSHGGNAWTAPDAPQPVATRPDTNMTAQQMVSAATRATPQAVGLPTRRDPDTTPEQDDASRRAAQTTLEAGYAKSAADQDANRERLQQRDKTTAIGLNLKNLQDSIANEARNAAYLATLGPNGTGKDNLAASKIRMDALNTQLGIATGQYKIDEDTGIRREGLRMGLTEKQIADLTTRRGQDINAAGDQAELGIKKDDLALRRETGIGKQERADNALAVRELANEGAIQKIVADTYAKKLTEYAGLENAEQMALDAAEAAGAIARGDTVIPGVKGIAATAPWFGKNTPEVKARPQKIVLKKTSRTAPSPDKLASQYYSPAEIAAYKKSKGLI